MDRRSTTWRRERCLPKIPDHLFDDRKKKKSVKQEDRLAKRLGGRRQKASGACPHNRGDVRMPELLTEAKRTDKKSISIKIAYLEKISLEAIQCDSVPAVAIAFLDTPPLVDRDWVMIPASFLAELLDAYRERVDGD